MKRLFALALSIILPGLACAKEAPKFSGPLAETMAGKRVLLVSAHPDDESLFAPLLAEVCRFNGATCHLVVAAEANSPGCIIPLKLHDLEKCSSMRRYETAASASNLNASHEFYGWRDVLSPWNDAGLDRNIDEWAKDVGGRTKLVHRIYHTLSQFKPDFLLGFDPRHGTTCNPNHRAIVLLALEAVKQLPPEQRPHVWLESDFAVPTTAPPDLAAIIDEFGIVRWPNDDVAITWYDSNFKLPNGRTTWDYLVDALRLNSTQFPDIATGKRTPNPSTQYRRVPFVKLADINPTQRGMCEPYTPEFSLSL
ncbi:PIG-L deacetylase family protein [Rhodanobacter sp. UC4451_H18]